ncbi:tripartite tricarboxylate transporter permease [Nocardioides euryhalodurans]|uniref:tripartite tricarboxylate transporter permease n=1 Tax=Nocardioides euryhalodurans TaxID=2518370 RepID=UPI00141E8361|nr:tripartite tricarboxylate transporter permease [Nocardioides euryhalodurans]
METLSGVLDAFSSFDATLWAVLVVGVVAGLLVGVLPGLTFVMGVLLLLPLTYGMGAESGVALMLAVYVAGTYGGAITSILLHVPGEPNHVPLLWDGHTMARQGRAAEALGWAAVAALAGGLVSWLVLAFVSEPISRLALNLGQPEYFLVVLIGLTSVLVLTDDSVRRSLMALVVGMLIATVGVDDVYGSVRFSFGSDLLRDGIDYLPVMIGVYAVTHVLVRFGARFAADEEAQPTRVRTVVPGPGAIWRRRGSLTRGVTLGSLIGTVPGAGATVASFLAYGVERQVSRDRHTLGRGNPDGVIAPQAASTATVGGALVPMLVLGIPGSAATAVILGALLLHDVQPGPQIFQTQPELVYTIIAALLVSVLLMFVLGLLTAGPMVRLLRVPEAYVAVLIVLFAYIGAFAIRNTLSDVWIMAGFAVLGLLLERYGFPLAPLVLGAILGPLAERYLTTTLIASDNDPSVFLTRPLSAALLALWVGLVVLLSVRALRASRASRGGAPDHPGQTPGAEPGANPGTDPQHHEENTRA